MWNTILFLRLSYNVLKFTEIDSIELFERILILYAFLFLRINAFWKRSEFFGS